MKHVSVICMAATLVFGYVVGWPAALPVHGALQVGPSLRFIAQPGYRIALAGKGWAPTARVTVTARAGGGTRSVQLKPTSRGRFVVGITNIDLCGGSDYRARDLGGNIVTLRGPALMCPNRLPEPVPTLTVLKGQRLHPRVVSLVEGGNVGAVTMHVGQLLNVHASTSNTMFSSESLYLDGTHWLQTASNAGMTCPRGAMCVPQTRPFMQWEAVVAGKAVVRFSPACRHTVPACALPDTIVDVTII